jgi:hypothetical protein
MEPDVSRINNTLGFTVEPEELALKNISVSSATTGALTTTLNSIPRANAAKRLHGRLSIKRTGDGCIINLDTDNCPWGCEFPGDTFC